MAPPRKKRPIPEALKLTQLQERLYEAVLGYPKSLTVLSEKSEVPLAVIFRFLQGASDIRLSTAGRLSQAVGLELLPKSK